MYPSGPIFVNYSRCCEGLREIDENRPKSMPLQPFQLTKQNKVEHVLKSQEKPNSKRIFIVNSNFGEINYRRSLSRLLTWENARKLKLANVNNG